MNRNINAIRLAIIILFSFSYFFIYAQENITIIQDPRIDTLLREHILVNEQYNKLQGYRVQIFFDAGNNSKQNAFNERDAFVEMYPEEHIYITFKEPYYRVRVGDFRSKMEAEGFLQKIINNYPNAFAIKDGINPPELLKEVEYQALDTIPDQD